LDAHLTPDARRALRSKAAAADLHGRLRYIGDTVKSDKPLKAVCSQCGNRNPIVVTRDRLQVWAAQRRGR